MFFNLHVLVYVVFVYLNPASGEMRMAMFWGPEILAC